MTIKRKRFIPLRDRVIELERIYTAAQKEITLVLVGLDIGGYQELKAIRMQEKVDRLVKGLNRYAMRWTNKAIPEAYNEERKVSRTRLEILGAELDGKFDQKTHDYAIEDYTDKTMNDLVKANQSIKVNVATFLYLARQAKMGLAQFQAFDLRDEEILAGLLDRALKAGRSRNYAYSLIREHFRKQFGDAKFIRINGRNYNLKYYSRNVARTRLRQMQSEAVKNSCKEFDNDLVEISDHGTITPICLPYEGNVYSISGKDPEYPFLDAWPPFHNQCQHHAAATSRVALGMRG